VKQADEENSATIEAVDEFASSTLERVCYPGEWRWQPGCRSRRPVCVRGVRDDAANAPHDPEHEPAGQPL
jgi:hypothetical protein